ncbi:type II toxin-antitoxin system VapC family toxin [Ammonifex thiophilus]|uniref:type II toxin-antitoxin system VapC family toxin n=1 Tax=Ammonifex thiophilus TaxID=444093 RepID=UPI0014035B63|nr:type II toxin-antitoxin system VapC family toxin [Ammonifex thiophilus]
MVVIKYLVDTDWIVYFLRGKEPYVSLLKRYRSDGLAVSIVSVAELYEGVYRASDPRAREQSLLDFLGSTTVLEVDFNIARTFGQLRAELRKQGLTVADMDLLIGSTAIFYNLILLTDNRKHYEKIPGIKMS